MVSLVIKAYCSCAFDSLSLALALSRSLFRSCARSLTLSAPLSLSCFSFHPSSLFDFVRTTLGCTDFGNLQAPAHGIHARAAVDEAYQPVVKVFSSSTAAPPWTKRISLPSRCFLCATREARALFPRFLCVSATLIQCCLSTP